MGGQLKGQKMYNFEFEKPSSIADAVAALGGDEAQALGGGPTLMNCFDRVPPLNVQ